MALNYYPMQDNYETRLSQARNGATGTVYVVEAPEFTMPASSYTFITVDPWTDKEQVFIMDTFSVGNKTLNASSVTVNKWPWLAYTQQSHSVGAKVIISDCYANWEAMKTAIDTADALNAIASNSVRWGVKLPTLAEAQAGTDASGADPYVTQPSQVLAMINERMASSYLLTNLIVSTSRSASAETIALKTDAWTDPTATDPIRIAFRSATAWTGDYTIVSITSATSITIPSTATMWASNAVPFRLWLVWFNDWGTFRLWIVNTQTTSGIFSLSDDLLVSSTTIGTGSDSAWVFYSGTWVTAKAYRILGYLDYTLTTAGTRDTAPSKIQLFWPWVKKPWDILQIVSNYSGAVATGTTVVPNDDSIPQITEWDQYFTQAITPNYSVNKLLVESIALVSNSVAWETMVMSLFQDATAWALASTVMYNGANYMSTLALDYIMRAWTTSATTFRIRIGWNSGTLTLNGVSAGRKYWWVCNSWLRITEFMV